MIRTLLGLPSLSIMSQKGHDLREAEWGLLLDLPPSSSVANKPYVKPCFPVCKSKWTIPHMGH